MGVVRRDVVGYGRGQVHVTLFSNFWPQSYFGIGESRHFKFRVLIDTVH